MEAEFASAQTKWSGNVVRGAYLPVEIFAGPRRKYNRLSLDAVTRITLTKWKRNGGSFSCHRRGRAWAAPRGKSFAGRPAAFSKGGEAPPEACSILFRNGFLCRFFTLYCIGTDRLACAESEEIWLILKVIRNIFLYLTVSRLKKVLTAAFPLL